MRLIEITPEKHLRVEAFDEVTLNGPRIFFSLRGRPVATHCPVREHASADANHPAVCQAHAQTEYARLVDWLAEAMSVKESIFRFKPLPPKGPDSHVEMTEAGAKPDGSEQVFA